MVDHYHRGTVKGENTKEEKRGGGREVAEREERRGAKGKISPCNDHGGEPQSDNLLHKKKGQHSQTN